MSDTAAGPAFSLGPNEEDRQYIETHLKAFNDARETPKEEHRPFSTLVRDVDGVILGGLIGKLYSDWAHIDLFWISEQGRGQGLGRRILQETESQLRRQGCKRLYLYTASFQAPGFYRKMGYEETGVDEACPGNDTRYFFRKILAS